MVPTTQITHPETINSNIAKLLSASKGSLYNMSLLFLIVFITMIREMVVDTGKSFS